VASIAIEHLTKRYPTGTVALDDVNVQIADGEFDVVERVAIPWRAERRTGL